MALFSPSGLLNAVARFGAFSVRLDIGYGPDSRHGLDVYLPASIRGPLPIAVFFYGGGWEDGERADYLFVGAALARSGIVCVIPDYRTYPQVKFPGFLQDAALAVRWARANGGDFGGDPDRITLMGHSAGAHIAAMLAFDGNWLAGVGLDAGTDLAGMAGLAGPYDFLPLHSRTLEEIFSPAAHLSATQPINFVGPNAPPAFLATGRTDRTVDPGNSLRLANRLQRFGNRVDLRVYPNVGHRTLIGAIAAPLRPLAPVLRDLRSFISTTIPHTGHKRIAEASRAGT